MLGVGSLTPTINNVAISANFGQCFPQTKPGPGGPFSEVTEEYTRVPWARGGGGFFWIPDVLLTPVVLWKIGSLSNAAADTANESSSMPPR